MKKIISTILFSVSAVAFANGGTFVPTNTFSPHCYFGVEVGYGMSSDVNLSPNVGNLNKYAGDGWHFPDEGVLDGDDLGSAPLFGASIGYVFTQNMSLGLSYDWMGYYKYNKFFNATNDSADSFGSAYNDDNIYFQPILATLRLNPSQGFDGFTPFVEVGAGVSLNNSGDFNSFNLTDSNSPNRYDFTISPKTTTSFAWKAGAGVDYLFHARYHFILGYRYTDVGTLETQSTRYDIAKGNTASIAPLEADHIGINQIYTGITYDFNA